VKPNSKFLRLLIILLVFILPLFIYLALSQRDFIRESIVIPMMTALWFGDLLIKSTPQHFFWIILLIVVLILSLRGLRILFQRQDKYALVEQRETGRNRISLWWTQIISFRRDPSIGRFPESFYRLILEVLSFQEQSPPTVIERALRNDTLDLPEDVRLFINLRKSPPEPTPVDLLAILFQRFRQRIRGDHSPTSSPYDQNLAEAIHYLEEQLGIDEKHGS